MSSPGGDLGQQGWQVEARCWLSQVLPDGPAWRVLDVRERTWGSCWHIEAGSRRYWFKRGHPVLWHEVRLRRVLVARAPDQVLPVVADDAERGWMLTADQGPALATLVRSGADEVAIGTQLAVALATVQRQVSLNDLRGIDLPVFEPADAVRTLDEQLAPFSRLPSQHPAHLDASQRESALSAMESVVRRWKQLDATGLPGLGIDHNDLHTGNAFAASQPGGLQVDGVLLNDWGDAVIAHPFSSMRVLLGSMASRCSRAQREQVIDAYLGQFGDPEPLRAALELAVMLAVPQRLHAWTSIGDPPTWQTYADYLVPLWQQVGRVWHQATVA